MSEPIRNANPSTNRRSFIAAGVRIFAGWAILGDAIPCFCASQSNSPEATPKFHKHEPQGSLPRVRDHNQYASKPVVQRIYKLAAAIRSVLYQLPCYCFCDRAERHNSLLDCFIGEHGVECGICQREVVFAFRKTRLGWRPAEIRRSIINRQWEHESVDDVEKLPEI